MKKLVKPRKPAKPRAPTKPPTHIKKTLSFDVEDINTGEPLYEELRRLVKDKLSRYHEFQGLYGRELGQLHEEQFDPRDVRISVDDYGYYGGKSLKLYWNYQVKTARYSTLFKSYENRMIKYTEQMVTYKDKLGKYISNLEKYELALEKQQMKEKHELYQELKKELEL